MPNMETHIVLKEIETLFAEFHKTFTETLDSAFGYLIKNSHTEAPWMDYTSKPGGGGEALGPRHSLPFAPSNPSLMGERTYAWPQDGYVRVGNEFYAHNATRNSEEFLEDYNVDPRIAVIQPSGVIGGMFDRAAIPKEPGLYREQISEKPTTPDTLGDLVQGVSNSSLLLNDRQKVHLFERFPGILLACPHTELLVGQKKRISHLGTQSLAVETITVLRIIYKGISATFGYDRTDITQSGAFLLFRSEGVLEDMNRSGVG